MSLFPLTYRLCNPIIELPPRAPPCGGVSFPKASAKVQPPNQTAKLFHDFFQTFLYHRHTKHLHHVPHTPGIQKHKRTQKKITEKHEKNTPRPAQNKKLHEKKHKAKSTRTAKKTKTRGRGTPLPPPRTGKGHPASTQFS